jgi:hypothetical protein
MTSRLRSRVDVKDLESSVRTGDVILFSSKHAGAQAVKCFTASTWDHIGIVVRFGQRHVYILEYAGGVFLYPLFTRLYTYYAIQGRLICLRRLVPGQDRAQMQRRVETFVRNVLGHSPPSIQEMVVAVLKQEGVISSFISKLAGGGAADAADVKDDLETMFCSKLIAAVYKDVGLIAGNRLSSDFLPKHFSQQYDEFLDLQRDAMLGPELPINFDSVKEMVDALREELASEARFRPEAIVRAVSELYLSASSGMSNGLDGASEALGNLRQSSFSNLRDIGTGIGTGISELPSRLSERFSRLERGLHGYSAEAEAALQKALAADGPRADGEGRPPVDLSNVPGGDGATGLVAKADGAGGAVHGGGPTGGLELRSGELVDELMRAPPPADLGAAGRPAGAAEVVRGESEPLLARAEGQTAG